jgi:hypothetical protein
MGEVVTWPISGQDSQMDLGGRLERLIAIFSAIDAGEMLAALPECEIARKHHVAALHLLAIAESELHCLRNDITLQD